MSESYAQYSCDNCHSRKIGCSRDLAGCRRCTSEGRACSYSRSGVIHRTRRRNRANQDVTRSALYSSNTTPQTISDQATGRPCEGADNTETAYDRLQQIIPSRSHQSVRVIAELLEEYTEAWQGSEAFEKLSKAPIDEFFVFSEPQTRCWLDNLNLILEKEELLIFTIPPEVYAQLASSRPQEVQDRSWLVMFYSVAIYVEHSKAQNTHRVATLSKLRRNLWLAFNDVRLLIEPSPARIQALIILATYVEEFMTPCVCWSLITKACTMLQALGIVHWRLDTATSDVRAMLFWRLNMLDKALALILCRAPAFHREMASQIAMPTLNRLMQCRPKRTKDYPPALFEAHYLHQMHLVSCIVADVWHALYGQDTEKVQEVKERLEAWYRQAKEVIEAAALVERPLLTAKGAAAVDLGRQTLRFQYLSLVVLLTVSSRQLRSQSIGPSQEMLNLLSALGDAIPDHKGPYACLLWQYLHCPLAAFGALWGELVMKTTANPEQSLKSMEAIAHLPLYLGKLGSRHALAARLQSITARIVEQARMIVNSQEASEALPVQDEPTNPGLPAPAAEILPIVAPNESLDPTQMQPVDDFLDDRFIMQSDPFFGTTFDWFAWGGDLEV
ncbi:hypothetical protein E4U38_003076 [Claviceps purpurea]|nr:hypothetical protein E4U38_003076 [Claviceps purpurea]